MNPCPVVELWGHGKPVGTKSIGLAEGLIPANSVTIARITPLSNTWGTVVRIADISKIDVPFKAGITALQLVIIGTIKEFLH